MDSTQMANWHDERRRAKRVLAPNEFLLEFKKNKKILMTKGFGCDLSVLGVRFNTLLELEKGEQIQMVMHFSPKYPQGRALELSARVVRIRELPYSHYFEVACEFTKIKEDDQLVIRGFMAWLVTQPWSESYGMDLSENTSLGRRMMERVPAQEKFLVEFKKGPDHKSRERGYGYDLSVAGVSFKTLLAFKKGAVIHLTMHLDPKFPGTKTIDVRGEVVRVNHREGMYFYQVACKFHDRTGQAKMIVKDFMEWLKQSA